MDRLFPLLILSLFLFCACAGDRSLNTRPVESQTIPDTVITAAEKRPEKAANSLKDSQTLYEHKQYDNALMTLLEADPKLLEDLPARKLLWRINDRLVTAQWYLQKSIAELLNGHKGKAGDHLDQVLKLYPDHKPSRLLRQNLDSIDIKAVHKTPKTTKPLQKKESILTGPATEDLNLADYYLMTGSAYFERGQLQLAKRSWLRGLDIVPSHKIIQKKIVTLLKNEGLQLFGQGHLKASIEKWEEALHINPDDPETNGYLDKARKAEERVRSIE